MFPRRTKATPIDSLAYVGGPDLFAEADEVYISVSFTWDLPEAERLEKEWRYVAPVKIGGPATGQRGEDFTPGLFLKKGYLVTSRGCDNTCWFCSVWRREGKIAELRLNETLQAGFLPMAMLYRDDSGFKDTAWGKFQTEWARPAIIYRKYKEVFSSEKF